MPVIWIGSVPLRRFHFASRAVRAREATNHQWTKILDKLSDWEARSPQDIETAFGAMAQVNDLGAILMIGDALFFGARQRIAELALDRRLALIVAGPREYVLAGALMTYGANAADLFRRAATYVDKILKGAKPGVLPIEQPTKFDLVVNLTTAKALGLTMPEALLVRADKVIE